MKRLSIEKKLNASAFTFVAILSATAYSHVAQAAAGTTASTSSTYIGADAVYASMKFKENYGSNIFSKKGIPGVNLFVGHMFNDNWGAEIGYEVDKKMKKDNVKLNEGQIVAGALIAPGLGFELYNTQTKQHHTYLGVLGKHSLFNSNMFASLMLGVSLSHINAKYNIFDDGTPAHVDITRTFAKTKPIPMIRASIEYKVTDKLGLRALTTWRKTSKFKIIAEQAPGSEIKLKNTINIGAGITYYIN